MIDSEKIFEEYVGETSWRVRENSNVTKSIGGLILAQSGAASAYYWLNKVYNKEISDAHKNCDIHLHDLSILSPYCAGWSIKTLLEEGFGGIVNKINSAPAKHLSTACQHIVNYLGCMQNEWAGAQAFSSFDTYLAPFIVKDELVPQQVNQALQNLCWGINTPSRWGCVPLTTEVLTPTGWKKYNELKDGDDIYGWDNGKLKIQKNLHTVIKDFKGKLLSFKNNYASYNQTVTPEHRCLTTGYSNVKYPNGKIRSAAELTKYFKLPTKIESKLPNNENISDIEIEIAARMYCDGSFDFRENGNIHKITYFKTSTRENSSRISELFDAYGLEYTLDEKENGFNNGGYINHWNFYGENAKKIVALTGSKTKIKKIFAELGSSQSWLFLETWMKSDGLYDKYRLQYDNEDIADTLQHIALRAGYTSLKYTKVTKPSFLGKDNTKPNISNYIKLRKMNGVEYKEKVEIDYDDKVWCPSTELGTVIFRDENKSVFISGNSQSPFSNITLDIKVPKDLKKKHPVLGGEKMKFTYSDCQDAMDIFNIELFKIFEQGDSAGNIFQYPIPTINITKDFDWESPVVKQIMKVTAKYGIPYFSNYINSDMSPDDVRSMCTTEDSKIRIRTKENWVRITHDDGRMEYKKETDI